MKRALLFSLVIVAFITEGLGQEQTPADSLPPVEVQRQMFIYSLATKYNDPVMAKISLYNLLAQNPRNTTVMDSLAVLYFQDQDYVPAALISQDIIRMDPSDMLAAEIGAYSFENLGVPNKAIPLYEKLYLNNNDLGLLYQIAFLQYSAKRYEESLVNIETIMSDPKADTRPLLFPLKDGRNQQVSMKAGIYRLKGMLEEDRGNIDQAREAYQKALEIAPEFESAQDFLNELEQ